MRRSTTARPVTEPRVTATVESSQAPADLARDHLRERSRAGRAAERLAVEPEDEDVRRPAEARGCTDHRVEDRLDVRRGSRDRSQDLGGGRLLLEGLGELAVARLQVADEAGVLDGDQRLIGERLQELDVAVGEWLWLGAPGDDASDGMPLPEHGHRDDASYRPCHRERGQSVLGILLQIRDVDHCPVQERAPDRAVPPRRARERPGVHVGAVGRQTVLGEQMDQIAVELEHPAELTVAELHRVLGEHVEDGPHVGRA